MAPNAAATPMRIGQHALAGQYWPGVIDDASFFPTALTASQVAAHYDASVNGSTATSAATAVVSRRSAGGAVEYGVAGGVGDGAGGADGVGVVGVVVGDGADFVCVSVASL